MKLDRNKIRRIVEETVDKFLDLIEEENDDKILTSQLDGNIFKGAVGQLEVIERDRFDEWSERVWEMLVDSYEPIGGLKSYRHYKDFCNKHPLVIIIKDDDNELLACATYRSTGRGDLKMTAIGCIQDDNGKLALQQIIKDNIDNFHLRYWAEVSGPIEHWFKKYNGYPMPNKFASDILNIPQEEIKLSTTDMVHYDREIGDGGFYTKMIFGCPSDDIFEKVKQDAVNYIDFQQYVNKELDESDKHEMWVRNAFYIIERLYRAHEEDGLNELIQEWYEALTWAIGILTSVEKKDSNINTYIEYGNYLLNDMQLLELHPLKF